MKFIKNHNAFKLFLKADSELTVDLVLKSNRIVIPSDLQNYVVLSAHYGYLEIFKTIGLLRTKEYFFKLDELVEKPLGK